MIYKRHSKKSRLNLGWGFIGLVAGLIIFGRLGQTWRASCWWGKTDFSWIKQIGEELTIYTLIPEYDKLIIWQVPGNTLVETTDNYGVYQWKNVFSLGQLEGRGGELLQQTSQKVIGLPINGWKTDRQTNLSWYDRFKWWLWTKFKIKQQLRLNLKETGALLKDNLPDGSEIWRVEAGRLDQIVNQETFSQAVAAENLRVGLVNDQRFFRVIANHGITVVSSRSETKLPDKTELWFQDKKVEASLTARWLKQLFPGAKVNLEIKNEALTPVVIIVGKDYN